MIANLWFKLGHFETRTATTNFLIFLEIKGLLAKTNYSRFLMYLIAIYELIVKEIDFSMLAFL